MYKFIQRRMQMYRGVYKIAGHRIEIVSLYEEVHRLCKEYRYDGEIEVTITVMESDILEEREKSIAEDKKEGLPIRQYPDSYLETLSVYRKLTEYLLDYDILLFHGSVVAVDGQGYLFTAKSGTGKSTHTNLWMQMFQGRAMMVNDDKPLLEVGAQGIIVYGTPWDGKHHRSTNTSVPLKAICILNRGQENKIEKVEKKTVYPLLLQQTYRSRNIEKLKKTLCLFEQLLERVDVYVLFCTISEEAVSVAYDGMQ